MFRILQYSDQFKQLLTFKVFELNLFIDNIIDSFLIEFSKLTEWNLLYLIDSVLLFELI